MQEVLIEQIHTYLQIQFDYNATPKGMLPEIKKSISKYNRRYCPETKRWYFDKSELGWISQIIKRNGLDIIVTDLGGETEINTQEFRIEWVEQQQSRRYIMPYALYLKNRFIAEIPYNEMVRYWQENPYSRQKVFSAESNNFYKLLEVTNTATTEEIKSSYRQLARQFHPDISTEPDAHELFVRINSACEVLSDPKQRKKYDAAIKFSQLTNKPQNRYKNFTGPPVTCGRIKGSGRFHLGLFKIDTILKWQDVIKDGKIMCSIYNPMTKKYTVNWEPLTN
ncbi:MAG: J domain-containing protein [Candidatus Hodarchaeales archaeon]